MCVRVTIYCSGNATRRSVCIVEVSITVNSITISGVAQEFMSSPKVKISRSSAEGSD